MDSKIRTYFTKENALVVLAVFTFVIPIIPIGAFAVYNHYFSSDESSQSTSNTSVDNNTTYPYSSDTNVTSSGSYESSRGSSDCTSDCSGHDAGYDWGEQNDICDTSYDNGKSESFNEGVRAWAEDNCASDYGSDD